METNRQIQAKFHTKNEKFAVPDFPFSIPINLKTPELNTLIQKLLSENSIKESSTNFEFIIGNEILRLSLGEHLENKEISAESVVEIEYVEKSTAPSPENCLQHDDWVSAVHTNEAWILTGCYDNTLHIWSLDGEHKLTIPGHLEPVKAVSWLKRTDSVDGIHSFTSSSFDQTAMVWEWNSLANSVNCVYVCRGHASTVTCIAPDDEGYKFATGSWDRMIKIWSSQPDEDASDRKRLKTEDGSHSKTLTPLMTLAGHKEVVSAVEWLSPTDLCSASWDHTIRLWDVEMGGIKSQLVGTKNFLDISYSPLNRLLISGSTDRHIRLWDPRQNEGALVKNVFTSHNGWVTSVAWSPNDENQFISGSYDAILKLWDIRCWRTALYDMGGHEDQILCCDWSNPSYLLSGGSDNKLKIFRH